jgi:hypothetical protein
MGAPLFDLDDDGVSGDSADFHPFRQFITVRHNFQYVVLLLSFPYVHRQQHHSRSLHRATAPYPIGVDLLPTPGPE